MAQSTRTGAPVALIVEDDPELRQLGAALLEETNLRVVECENAEEAMTCLAREGDDVALVFTDVRLPGTLDGLELARNVRALWPQVAMVVTSGYSLAPSRELPPDVVYMPKPWLPLAVLIQAEQAAARILQRRAA
jgi:CheY-like chemotaxis protein